MLQRLQATRQTNRLASSFIYIYLRKSTESSNFDWRSDDSSDYGKLKLVADKNKYSSSRSLIWKLDEKEHSVGIIQSYDCMKSVHALAK